MSDLTRTQHYSTNELLLDGLKNFIPENSYIIEPFYGRGDLVKDFNISEYYDIAFDTDNPHYRDTLLSPPDYKDKYIITNPPYLAKNKAKDKTYFNLYLYDDLYKIALSTFSAAKGGILVIPLNFFTDERSAAIRNKFLSEFSVKRLNVYLDAMFSNTDYNVCSFYFESAAAGSENIIPVYIYQNGTVITQGDIGLAQEYSYRLGGEFFFKLKKQKALFSRITEKNRDNPTHINIICIDKVGEPLHFYYSDEVYYGKESDRNLATLSSTLELNKELELQLIEKANFIINEFRCSTYNLPLTNFRDRSRKRIGFTEAYKILSLAYEIIKSKS